MTERRDILIVDDNPGNIQLVATELRDEGYGIAFARSGPEALEQASRKHFDLFLLDIMMPEMDGIELCRRIKEQPEYKDAPVLFLTAKDEKETVLRGFEAGGVDYVTKPFYGPEVRSRVQAQLRAREAAELLEQTVDDLNKQLLASVQHEQELKAQQEEMARFNKSLLERANTDQLTGLANRYHIMSIAEYERERATRAKTSFCVILADVDHFKEVNDSYGHECGDMVLQEVARRMRHIVRAQDRVARWGGEEFLVFLPDTGGEGAEVLAERLRHAIGGTAFSCDHAEFYVTMTLGVSACPAAQSIEACIEHADAALYEGKRAGRNRSVTYGSFPTVSESD
jgi:diguanylate cyclase (GGDEF)-like protein